MSQSITELYNKLASLVETLTEHTDLIIKKTSTANEINIQTNFMKTDPSVFTLWNKREIKDLFKLRISDGNIVANAKNGQEIRISDSNATDKIANIITLAANVLQINEKTLKNIQDNMEVSRNIAESLLPSDEDANNASNIVPIASVSNE